MKPTGKKGKKKKPTGRFDNFIARYGLVTGIGVVVIVIGLAVFCSLALTSYNGDKEVTVYIPSGSDRKAIADTLDSRLGRDFGGRVYSFWKLQGGKPEVATGAYTVARGMSALRLSRRIATGTQSPVRVSFPATRGMTRLAERITRHLDVTPGQFLEATNKILTDSGFTAAQFPAVFMPDTYEFYWNTPAESLVKRMLTQYRRFWNAERLAKARRLGLTPVEVSTLASIVEEETAKGDERPMVARLYLNRLEKGMKLQADPTVKFAIGDEKLRRITHAMLSTPSPYNTYLHQGLPPGPIRVVEPSTIDAVLDAPVHDYIYMCAKEDFSGYHNFATTYADHEANARRYQAELNRRGIR